MHGAYLSVSGRFCMRCVEDTRPGVPVSGRKRSGSFVDSVNECHVAKLLKSPDFGSSLGVQKHTYENAFHTQVCAARDLDKIFRTSTLLLFIHSNMRTALMHRCREPSVVLHLMQQTMRCIIY